MDSVLSLLDDAKNTVSFAQTVNSEGMRTTILMAAREGLLEAAALLPKPKKYILPAKGNDKGTDKASFRTEYTPWSPKKADHEAFLAEMLSWLRGAFPARAHRDNMTEAHKLWNMHKEAGSLKGVIESAKASVSDLMPSSV
jgi:hypothetical protein